MLPIHLITLIASATLGFVFAFTKWKSVLAISLVYYLIYTFQFIRLLGLTSDEIVPASLFCLALSYGPFLAINIIRIIYTNPKRFIELSKIKSVRYSIAIITVVATSFYVFTNWDDIRCTDPKFMDVYNDNAFYRDEIKIIDKVLNVENIDKSKYDIIRLYYLPSFSNEVVVEIKIESSKIISIVKCYTVGKSIWDDQQALKTDFDGKVIGGRVKGINEYKSSVNIKHDTLNNHFYNDEVIKVLTSSDLYSMKSIQIIDETNCFISQQIDGTSYVVIAKRHNKPANYFEFDESNYIDQRYAKTRALIEKLAANKR